MSQQIFGLTRPGIVFSLIIGFVCFFWRGGCPDLSGQEGHPIWFSAGIAHLLQSLMCNLFRDALLQMLVVKSSYFLSAPFHQPEELLSPE